MTGTLSWRDTLVILEWKGTPKHSFQLFITGNVKDYDYCPIIENYQLTLTDSNLKQQSIRQEIYTDIKLEGKCQLASLQWFGDVDGDDKADFIISTSTHEERKHYLFLRSQAAENNYVGQPLRFSIGSCY